MRYAPDVPAATSNPLTLAIETSNPSCEAGVAIGSRAGIRGVEPVTIGDGRHDDLMTAIDRLCTRTGTAPRDLGRIAVSIGPGGYTSLRIAIATAKMLCESLRAECIAIETARIVAHRVHVNTPFTVVLASKDATAFATDFDSPGSMRGPGRLITSLDELDTSALIADRYLPIALADEAAARGIAILAPRFDPAACLELSFNTAPIDPVALAPHYAREPEAVTKWRQRKA